MGDATLKFTEEQWKLYNALKIRDKNIEADFWISDNFRLGTTEYTRCPLCGYETTSTNVHRKCPLAPLLPNEKFINGEKLAVYNKLANLNMIDVKKDGKQRSGFVPKGWQKLQWRRDITPEQWDKIIAKQDFVHAEDEECE